MLVLTHYDSDHVNGTADILTRLNVETLYMPAEPDKEEMQYNLIELAKEHHTKICYISEVQKSTFGEAEIQLMPLEGSSSKDNENGLAVQVSLGDKAMLITGDMDRNSEKKLIETYDIRKIQVLVAGHHGGKESTSTELLEATLPETVCISVGSNSYGHPAEETLRRLAECSCNVYRTDLHGNIRLSWDEGE
jgi:competence protein ComEC